MAFPGIAIHDPTISGIGDLPSAYDLSVPSPLLGLLANPLLERVYAIVAQPYDPALPGVPTWPPGGAAGVHLSSNEYHSLGTDAPAHQHFSARLKNPYNIQVNLMSAGRLAAHSLPGYGTVEILNPGGELDAFTGWSWNGCSIAIYLGQKGAAWSTFTQIFSGTAAGVTWTTESILVQLRDLQHLFSVPLQKQLYTAPCPLTATAGDKVVMSTFPQQTGSLTVEGWVYAPDVTTAGQRFLGTDDGTHGWEVGTGNAGILRFLTRDLSTAILDSSAGALVAGWNPVAVVYDHAAQTKTLYVGAASVGTIASLTGTLAASSGALALFAANTGTVMTAPARWAELRIWNVARTQVQIQANMRLRMLGTETGLVGYWPGWVAGDGVGTVLHDQTSGGHDGAFSGTTGWGLGNWVDPSIAGKPIPVCVGVVRQAEAVLVDPNTPSGGTYQGHVRGMQSYDTIYDNGGALTPGTQYTTDPARGYFTLLQSAAGQITFDAHGDNVGGFVSSAPDVARRIATAFAGIADPAGVNVASIAAANALNSAPVGYATGIAPVNLDAALDAVMSSVGGWWATNRLGLFTVGILTAPGAASLLLTERDVIIDAKPLQRLSTPDPAWRLRLGYHRIWKTQQIGNFVTSLADNLELQWSQDYSTLTANGSLPAPGAAYPLADDRSDSTLLDVVTDAQVEADRRYKLDCGTVRRDLYQVALVPTKLFQYDLGQVVSPTLTLQNQRGPVVRLLAGQSYVIVGMIENVQAAVDQPDDVQLILWG